MTNTEIQSKLIQNKKSEVRISGASDFLAGEPFCLGL